jgi:catechol 2,3-dioxygenase-like lactoylglutathione lyase family enzyme
MARLITDDLSVALIPDDHRARAACLPGPDPLIVTGGQRVILDRYSQPPDTGIKRRPFGNRPRPEDVADPDPEIEMQRRRVVQLNHEARHRHGCLPATDLHRARAFYEQVLGLPVAEHNDFACVLDANGTMLRITAAPEVRQAGYTVLGWRVTDITAAIRGLAARGVVFLRYEGMDQDSDGVWTAPGGDKVAWFTDPDGNVLSLTQFV